ncbi:hypothetical protein [Granulicella sibirica]|uniref:Uncharacterized protein n=1 Tax=Granulicella sibirica TaxID=2479048 RepID=A0A4Q0SUL3_9BACT|nr:hypothetical protein [Granulicella sibirica]RXH54417.1 hypothetical protein GRAN_4713 [Granulicella sibirica]
MIPVPTKPDAFSPASDPTNRASVVNRTHRVVRERARNLQAQRSRNRALFAPLVIASSLVIILISTFWIMFDEYELSPTDVRFHLPLLLIWFLPVTGALLIVALVRRIRSRSAGGETR